MVRSKRALFAGLVLALSAAFCLPQFAQAAAPTAPQPGQHTLPSSCLPEFNSSKHVYVSTELREDARPETLNGLEGRIASVASEHGLQVFVVACQANYDWQQPAADLANTIAASWQNKSGFDANKFLIITWIRKEGSATAMSTAAVGGTYLLKYGFDKNKMSSADGPVAKDRQQFLNDSNGRFVKIVSYINADIDHQDKMARLPFEIAFFVFLACLAGAGIFRFVKFSSHKKAAAAKLAEWKTKFDNANTAWMGLQTKYLDFFKTHGTNWKDVFVGETLSEYTAATAAFDDLNIRTTFARQRVGEAESAFAKGGLFSFGGFDTAVALLTTTPITVTGKALADENLTLFGSTTDDKTFAPDELLAGMEELFATANTKAAKIMKSFEGAETNKQAILAEVKQIEEIRDAIVAKKLSFAPYQRAFDQIAQAQKEFMDMLGTNPLGAFSKSETVKANTDSLVETLKRASKILESVAPTEQKIADAVAHVAQVRGKDVSNSYPEKGDEVAFANAKFLLTEEGGNPDTLIAKANERLEHAGHDLMAGQLNEAEAELAGAAAAAQEAVALADKVVAAKANIEKSVPDVRSAVKQLEAETPAADTATNTLVGEFIAANVGDIALNVKTAKIVAGNFEGILVAVREDYFAQKFLEASDNVNCVSASIAGARKGLSAVHTLLASLQAQRDHSRATAKAARTLADSLFDKLSANNVSTSAATTTKYNNAVPALPALETEVAQSKADWVKAALEADQMLATLKAVDASIDQEKHQWEAARNAVSRLDAAVNTAYNYVSQPSTRGVAASKYQSAQTAHAALTAQVALAQQDWASIEKQAVAATALAEAATAMAQADAQIAPLYNAAAEQFNAVNAQNSAGGFGEGVYADLSTASNTLAAAMAAWDAGNQNEAARLARLAHQQSIDAAEYAQSEVQTIINNRAMAIAAAAAAAAQAAADEERRRQNPVIVTGGGWSGGGDTGGGGWSGGGTSGGGNDSGGNDSGGNAGGSDSSGGNAGGVDDN